jgi:glycosyltransferase involved in cell wall biosynthesis
MLSVVIPSYKDPLLHKTIDSLLENAEGEIEIIPVLDGYWPVTPVKNDKRIKIVHLGRNRGMRGAINAGVVVANGEFLMRVDEHQIFGKGYDRILTETCEPNWIVTPRRYFLDPVKWERMDLPYVDRMKLEIRGGKFTGTNWPGNPDLMIEESMAMQGSCWVMPHKWWNDVIGELQTEGYGPLIQDSHEMVFKAWKAGGKLMVNKNTWHAHKHRSFARTHNNGTQENPANCDAGYAYAIKVWKSYYDEIQKIWFQ